MLIRKIDYGNITPDRYAITDQGVIFDLVKQKPMGYSVDKDGYYRVTLRLIDGTSRTFGVHRLVAIHFCNNPRPDIQNTVNHLNGEKKYNFASNLDWGTSADNTRHADQYNLRNVRGDANGHSKFTDDFVRSVCEDYEKGLQPMDIFRRYYPDTTVDGFEERVLYRLLYTLKKKTAWKHICEKYNYDTNIPRSNNKIYGRKVDTSSYTEDDIRLICEKLEEGMAPINVVTEVMQTPGCGFYEKGYERSRVADVVKAVATGKLWKSISREYNIDNALRHRISHEEYVKIFDEEMAAGTDPHRIPSKIGNKYGKGRNDVRRHFRRYLIDKGLLDKDADDYMSRID